MTSTYRSRGKSNITSRHLDERGDILEPVRHQPSPRGAPNYDYQMNDQQIRARQQMANV